jgi:hypothetical protein
MLRDFAVQWRPSGLPDGGGDVVVSAQKALLFAFHLVL